MSRVAELRHGFDSTFALARQPPSPPVVDLLAIRVDHDPYALHLSEISALVADGVITEVPSRARGLLGLTGRRGTIVAVYDLRVLLGYEGRSRPRLLAVTAADTTVGLAFDHFDGCVRVPREAIARQEAAQPGDMVREVVHLDGTARQVVQIPDVVNAIAGHIRAGVAHEEP
jgi:chemotaxis signal transduction protein